MTNFQNELKDLLNKHGDTSDSVLTDFLMSCITAWNKAIQKREASDAVKKVGEFKKVLEEFLLLPSMCFEIDDEKSKSLIKLLIERIQRSGDTSPGAFNLAADLVELINIEAEDETRSLDYVVSKLRQVAKTGVT